MNLLHPSPVKLDAFANGNPGNADLRPTMSHLESCQHCRNEVAFRRWLRDESAQLLAPDPPIGLLDRVLRDRAAGQRVILPADRSHPITRFPIAYRIAALILIAVMGLVLAQARRSRGDAPEETRSTPAVVENGGDKGLADIFGSTVFIPGVASAEERATRGAVLQPVGPQIDGRRLRNRAAKYQRRYIDSTGKAILAGEGTLDIRQTSVDGKPAWDFRRDWVEYATRLPGSRTTHDNERMLMDRRTLRLIKRDVDAFPYSRYSRITVAQRFNGDSVYGRMMAEGGDSRGVSRTFRRQLPAASQPYISDAFAPLLFTAIRITPEWHGRISVLGWAVRDNDVVYPIEFRNVGRENVTVPAGTFDCWHFLITSGARRFDFWTRTSDGLAVRSRNESAKATLGASELVLISESH